MDVGYSREYLENNKETFWEYRLDIWKKQSSRHEVAPSWSKLGQSSNYMCQDVFSRMLTTIPSKYK